MNGEKETIRRLAGQVAEIAHLPLQKKKIRLWKDLNSLKMKRPMVLTYHFPWSQGEPAVDELRVSSRDEFHRSIERHLRRLIFKWNHIRADMVVEPVYYSPIYVHDTGFGLEHTGGGKSLSYCSSMHTLDDGSPQAAVKYHPVLREVDDIERIKDPVITMDHQRTEEEYQRSCELLEPLLKVEKCGFQNLDFEPMDVLAKLWGITELMMDMLARPELIHRAMERMVDAYISRLDQFEALNILSLNSQRAGAITMGMGESFTDELPGPHYDPAHVRPHNMWGGASAQILSSVSPAMHHEFSITHEEKWLNRFGLASYGCCEPLHRKVSILKKLKNLRKISMSSWINLDEAVENMGSSYVFSYKPKPTFLAGETFDLQSSRREIQAVLEKTGEAGCQVELILRTIISYRSDLGRLSEWVRMAMGMVGADE